MSGSAATKLASGVLGGSGGCAGVGGCAGGGLGGGACAWGHALKSHTRTAHGYAHAMRPPHA